MKLPKPKKLASGSWHIQLRLDGKSYSITEATAKECKDKAALIKSQHLNNILKPECTLTLQAAEEKYLAQRSNVISPSTIRGYRTIMKTRFIKYQDVRLCDINSWQKIINDESKLCSAKTLHNAWGFIHSVLKENDVAVDNVRLPQVVKKEHPFLEPEQIKIFVKAIEGDEYELAMLLGLHGLRRSEILAVEKKDVYNDTIHIRGAVVFDENDELVKKQTNKNDTSRRDVPIFIPRTRELIKEAPSGVLCPFVPERVKRKIDKYCKQLGFEPVGFHGLRHSFASLCFSPEVNLPMVTVQKLGGWADFKTMNRIYTHVTQKAKTDAADKLTFFYT